MGRSPADVEAVLADLLRALELRLADPAATVEAWRERDALRGRTITWAKGSGVAEGIADDGRLRVRTVDGLVTLDAGEVHLGAMMRRP
jgi:BirA family biotin operon repressor/biotin-[acetyl-CoA-carboxylase] ligase